MSKKDRKVRIENILKKNFAHKLLIVRDDSKKHEGHTQVEKGVKETHFYIKIVFNNFENLSRVALHRKVYALLDQEFSSGLHALELDISSS